MYNYMFYSLKNSIIFYEITQNAKKRCKTVVCEVSNLERRTIYHFFSFNSSYRTDLQK